MTSPALTVSDRKLEFPVLFLNFFYFIIRPKKKYMCVYCHISKKSRVSQHLFFFFFLTISKTGNSRARFRNPIPVPESDYGISFSKFPVSRHLFYDELHSFSTFFALNFDKKLAVE